IKAGLWSRKANLRIQNPGVETWSFRVEEDPVGQGIPALGVEDIMREFGVSRIDVLKMDIEGSEVQVFHHSKGWLGAVGSL
ncbi:FkbM family methyltransferase, partial [Acinetobacter baumannii]